MNAIEGLYHDTRVDELRCTKLPVMVSQMLQATRIGISILRIVVFAVAAKEKQGMIGDGSVTHCVGTNGVDVLEVSLDVVNGILRSTPHGIIARHYAIDKSRLPSR